MEIYLVEDSSMDALYMSDSLAIAGYGVNHFASSTKFLKIMAGHSTERTPKLLVILDMFLPEADGIEILRKMSEMGFKGPVVLVSNMDKGGLKAAMATGLDMGMNVVAALPKPVDIPKLIELIEVERAS